MKVNYSPLWKKLDEIKMTKKEFRFRTKLGSSTYSKLVNNENVTTDTLVKICDILKCQISDIVECVEE